MKKDGDNDLRSQIATSNEAVALRSQIVTSKEVMADSTSHLVISDDIRSRIYTIRGVQVMLDRDLAFLYGVETKVLNQAVKRNIERFPLDFLFQLEKEDCLRSQIVTIKESRGKHLKYMPYAFTENGIAMLSSVLRSQTAIEVNIRIMREFVAMRRSLASLAPILTRLDTVERRQITDQSHNEERFTLILDAMRDKKFPPQKIFFDGQVYDAFEQVRKFVRSAKKELILIDPYADDSVLDILANKRDGVKLIIAKGARARLHPTAIDRFNEQFSTPLSTSTSFLHLTVLDTALFHDRFFIIDRKTLIHIGMSLNHLGKKCFAFSTFDPANVPEFITRLGLQ